MLPASAILENCGFSAVSDIEYIFSRGESLKWFVSGIELENTGKNAINIPKFSKYLYIF